MRAYITRIISGSGSVLSAGKKYGMIIP